MLPIGLHSQRRLGILPYTATKDRLRQLEAVQLHYQGQEGCCNAIVATRL